MTSPHFADLFHLYQRAISVGVVECFQKQGNVKFRRSVYSGPVVLWLMILQRLHAVGTLAAAVQLLIQGAADPLLQNCKRVREGRISIRTGSYSNARQKLPTILFREVLHNVIEKLRALMGVGAGPRIYLLDGSSLELEHSRDLAKKFPPAQNQHGTSHWPVLKLMVLHELESGLAEEPSWGPMYGAEAVSEQQLAVECMKRVPAGSAIMSDRNMGVLWVAYEARQNGLGVLLRLTDVRAKKLWSGDITAEAEKEIEWKASRSDGGKKRSLPQGASVTGRLIAVRVGRGKSKHWLYLFTTLDWPVKKVVELYGLRWNIETDLRSLKRTVRLHHVPVKTTDMLEKELLMAIAAYNLVRAVMCLAARKKNIDPRQLSFAMVHTIVNCAWPKLAQAANLSEFDAEFGRVLDLAGQCELPNRSKSRSFPRELWRHEPGFPYRRSQQDK